ncbi:uncharacterized protein LOC122638022 [Vespula pensylvanica]|uniref:Spaetzle domain-containing protein n=1 Tax=Vespula pensylvanica TaxID=30213 RepID=A0A834PAU0_VESPE|nr:uncharacterized protein LOC122638022 [Vespula pensylvanica]KAF7434710.1 hypothetical protein H0235_002901 [Vespula pensylvanica]
MAKIHLDVDYHPFKIVIKAVLLLWIAGETNSDSQPNFYEKYGLDRPSYPSWYKESPFMYNIEPKGNTEDQIFFPYDNVKSQIRNLGDPHICKNKTYCEDTPYYPSELVKNRLENNKNLMEFAVNDFIPKELDLSDRIDARDEIPMCVSIEKVIYPKTAQTVNGEWLFIAQMGQNFAQGVRIETCLTNSAPCQFVQHITGYVSSCEQKYIYRQLLAVDKQNLTTELFRFPSSCCCTVKFVSS